MLRITFVCGYALFILFIIALMAIKVISVIGDGSYGEMATRWCDYLFSSDHFLYFVLICVAVFLGWIALLWRMARRAPEWERRWIKVLLIGCSFMMVFFVVLLSIGLASYFFEGFAGEIAEKLAGFASSPIFMELSFFTIGLILLFGFNAIKRTLEGDEFVYLETVDQPSVKEQLPEHKHSAIYHRKPEKFDAEINVQIATIEGAMAMNDTKQAFELMMDLPEEVLESKEVIKLRQQLKTLQADSPEG